MLTRGTNRLLIPLSCDRRTLMRFLWVLYGGIALGSVVLTVSAPGLSPTPRQGVFYFGLTFWSAAVIHYFWIRPRTMTWRELLGPFWPSSLESVLFTSAGLALLAVVYTMLMGVSQILPFPREPSPDIYRAMLAPGQPTWMIWVVALLLAPWTEELLYRGLLIRAFMSHTPLWVACGASSILFGLLHPLELIPFTFSLGMCLALSYLWSRRLFVPVLIHTLWNLGQLCFLISLQG